MHNNLSNELGNMKYLFGYKAGKVISEQVRPGISDDTTKGLANHLLNSIEKNETFSISPFSPNKILMNPTISFNSNTGLGTISFSEITPSEKPTQPVMREIPLSANKEIKDKSQLFSEKEKIGFFPIKTVPSLMTALDLAQLMYVVGGDKNPKEFYNFISEFDSKLPEIFKKSISNHLSKSTFDSIISDKEGLRKIYDLLFGQKIQ